MVTFEHEKSLLCQLPERFETVKRQALKECTSVGSSCA